MWKQVVEMSRKQLCKHLSRNSLLPPPNNYSSLRSSPCSSCCQLAAVITGWKGHSLALSPSLRRCSSPTDAEGNRPEMKKNPQKNQGQHVYLCNCVSASVFVLRLMSQLRLPSLPLPRLPGCGRVFGCVCPCECVFCVCNARRQLNLLPLITGIVQPPEKKTHPISCDMGLTSCGPVFFFFSAVPVNLLISWTVRACETEFIGSPVALVPSALTSWLPRREWDRICLPLEGDWECGLIAIGTICSVGDGWKTHVETPSQV